MNEYAEVYELESFSVFAEYEGEIVKKAKVKWTDPKNRFRVPSPRESKILALLVKKVSQAKSTEEKFVSLEEIARCIWGKKVPADLANNFNGDKTRINRWLESIRAPERYQIEKSDSDRNYHFVGNVRTVVSDTRKLEMSLQTPSENSVFATSKLPAVDRIQVPIQFHASEDEKSALEEGCLKEEDITEQFEAKENCGVDYRDEIGGTIVLGQEFSFTRAKVLRVMTIAVACTLLFFGYYHYSPTYVLDEKPVTVDDIGIQTYRAELKNLKQVEFIQSNGKRYIEFNKHKLNDEEEKVQVVAERVDVGINTTDYQFEGKNVGLVIIDPISNRWGWGDFVSNNGKLNKLFSVQIGEKQDGDGKQYFTLLLVTSSSKIPKGLLTDEQLEKIEIIDSIRVKRAKSVWN